MAAVRGKKKDKDFKIDNKRNAKTNNKNNEKTDNRKTAHKKRDDDYNDEDIEKSKNKVEKAEYRTYPDNVGNFEYDDDANKDTSNNKADENDTDNSVELNASKAENNDKMNIEKNGKMNKVEKCISDDEVPTRIDNTNEISIDRKLKNECEIWIKKVDKLRNTVVSQIDLKQTKEGHQLLPRLCRLESCL
ncbi:1608_t:CDS:2 [Dentiscutata heterogama]|uniref:1608_t:CDS:1 n=1 Tax=Dentiscutata heterogama TaxID=1316150 RepID=A0ACA9KLM3_9GLOM|nr:1608_t:CDS:2 [Dentiscutata heterogama]